MIVRRCSNCTKDLKPRACYPIINGRVFCCDECRLNWENMYDGKDIDPGPYSDPVSHPTHYTAGSIECIDAIRAALGLEGFQAFCRGNVIKYSWRAGLKGDASTDLAKAETYARFAREKT